VAGVFEWRKCECTHPTEDHGPEGCTHPDCPCTAGWSIQEFTDPGEEITWTVS
jgi:hypothetical protein